MKKKWETVKLSEVLVKNDDWITLDPIQTYREVTIRMWGKGVVMRKEILGSEGAASRSCVSVGQFIISRIDARNGASGLVPPELEGAVVSNDFPSFAVKKDRLMPEFLGWMSKTKGFVDACRHASEGTTNRVRLKEEKFLAMEIALPPIAEQRRIVARIEEVAGRIAEAKRLRGEAEKAREALVNASAHAAVHTMAAQYGLTRLEEVISEACYGSSEKCSPERTGDAIPVLRIPNVASERLLLDDMKFARLNAREQEKLTLENGDILVVRTNGSLDLVGRCAVVEGLPEPMAFASYMIRLRFDSQRLLPQFSQWMLRHLRTSRQLIDCARTTAGQYNISLGRLRAASIPVPPLKDQRRIIADLDAMQAKADSLRRLQAQSAAELDALLPSILDRAFSGQM